MSSNNSNSSNYKRIAKNAGMLYFRMLFTILVTLYTSRVVLQTLGVEDFGVYSVVAGFVAMLGFLNNAMTSATQRFLSFELGKVEDQNIPSIFSMSMNIHILIALFALVIGETVGLWFVRTQLTIPSDRMFAAEWVYHLALFAFMTTVVTVPYKALIIAHEKMNVFAWISIFDVTLKLISVFALSYLGFDKLILFGALNLVVVLTVFTLYKLYCNTKHSESIFRFIWNKDLFKTILSYTGWNLWGNIAFVLSSQGINVLLNIFFGPAVNAARSISMEVSAALNSFVSSLQVAINPQIIKSYAADNLDYMNKLICYGAKYNFFLLFLISAPIFLNSKAVLTLWLINPPPYSDIFVKLIIINILIDCISGPLMTAAQATGRIKGYQITVGGILLLNFPVAYIALKYNLAPESVFYISILISILAFIARLIILKRLMSLPVLTYLKSVVLTGILVSIPVIFIAYLIGNATNELGFIVESIIMLIGAILSIILLGFEKIEREFLLSKAKLLYANFQKGK